MFWCINASFIYREKPGCSGLKKRLKPKIEDWNHSLYTKRKSHHERCMQSYQTLSNSGRKGKCKSLKQSSQWNLKKMVKAYSFTDLVSNFRPKVFSSHSFEEKLWNSRKKTLLDWTETWPKCAYIYKTFLKVTQRDQMFWVKTLITLFLRLWI